MKDSDIIQLGHGAGGSLQDDLIEFITKTVKIRRVGTGIGLDAFEDGATIPLSAEDADKEIVLSADGHTVFPLRFPGGDLGKLAVCGTVNDLCMMGAHPIALTSAVIVEEGMRAKNLREIMDSFNHTAAEAGVAVITGDTKVMPKGTLQEMIIVTTGIGKKPKNRKILNSNVQAGDKIIVTGSVGDHGIALMAARENIELGCRLESDVAILKPLAEIAFHYSDLHMMKDPTRGGLAAALNEVATKSHVSIWLKEEAIPIKKEVRAVADILGLDPLEIACEGRFIAAVAANQADDLVKALQTHPLGIDTIIIGEARADRKGRVLMETIVGGTRFVDMPLGELIPRIC
ncbi:MAG: hydrogenase maturation factor HypE [Promethearchaeota archaeon CR_4]|nr:MAG: hydrogenase maturation factor HypE [Candidatus Lokiarchaeota archaeon CR_4]